MKKRIIAILLAALTLALASCGSSPADQAPGDTATTSAESTETSGLPAEDPARDLSAFSTEKIPFNLSAGDELDSYVVLEMTAEIDDKKEPVIVRMALIRPAIALLYGKTVLIDVHSEDGNFILQRKFPGAETIVTDGRTLLIHALFLDASYRYQATITTFEISDRDRYGEKLDHVALSERGESAISESGPLKTDADYAAAEPGFLTVANSAANRLSDFRLKKDSVFKVLLSHDSDALVDYDSAPEISDALIESIRSYDLHQLYEYGKANG